MHLLAAAPGTVSDGSEPVDPGQSPADVIFLSAADTELAALSEARGSMSAPPEQARFFSSPSAPPSRGRAPPSRQRALLRAGSRMLALQAPRP